jgi:type I restriction enzyme S subunit
VVFSNHFLRLRLDPGSVDPAFVAWWLNYQWRSHQFERLATRWVNQAAVRKDDLLALRMELPSLPDQLRIGAILNQTDRLRRTRRYALELSDGLLVAIFRNRFGSRLHSWNLRPLGELVVITGGGTPSRATPRYFQGQIPWLTSKDMRGDYIWDTEEHITEEAILRSATKLVPAYSVLLVVKSKVLMHRLPVAIAKVPLCHGQDIKSIQCQAGLHYEFARFVLKHYERHLLNLARGANTEGLTLPMLEELPVPDVDYAEQADFADLVDRQEQLRIVQRESLRQAEQLFNSLLHQAFRTPRQES